PGRAPSASRTSAARERRAPVRGAAVQQPLGARAAAWTSWCSSPPGRAPSLSGTSGPRERRAPARWAALQQTPCSPAVRLDELVLLPPRASTESLGYVWTPETASTSSMGGLAADTMLSGSPPGRAGALPPGPLKLRLDLDQC